MPLYDSAPLDHSLELHELHYQLTLIQHWGGNQVQVAAPKGSGNFGEIIVNDWDLQDPCQNGKIVAHAKGLHIRASTADGHLCHTSFDIVFEEGSGLEGSTLQVMGPDDVSSGEWSIVGGTGKLTMARGVIYRTGLGENNGGAKADLQIHAFYIPMDRSNKYGPSSGKNVWRW